jgi:hypothetical protein
MKKFGSGMEKSRTRDPGLTFRIRNTDTNVPVPVKAVRMPPEMVRMPPAMLALVPIVLLTRHLKGQKG